MHSPRGFTLIELLAVVAVISILVGLSLFGLGRARSAAHRATCAANFRDMGVAILSYTHDHKGYLPGPLYVGQSASYSGDSSDGRIGTFLAPYLGLPDLFDPNQSTYQNRQPQLADALACPAWEAVMSDADVDLATARPYLLAGHVEMDNDLTAAPFGQAGTTKKPQLIGSIRNPTTAMALKELDQQNGGSSYSSNSGVAPKPVHDDVRMAVYFDGHVDSVPVDS